jgi:hypothetical protein
MLASCSEEPVNGPETGNGDTAKITIDLRDAATRAFVDPLSVDADNVINNLIVFVTRTGGVALDVPPIFVDGDDIASNVFEVTATTKADKVYIVTNTGPLATGPFAGVSTMTDVKAVTAKIDGTVGTPVAPQNVWMSGESTALTDATADAGPDGDLGTDDDIPVKTTTIQLYYIPAKVYVAVKNSMKNYVGGNTEIEGVQITNAGAWTGFIMTNPTATFGTDVRPDFRVARTTADQFPFYYNGVAIAAFMTGGYADAPAQYGDPAANDFVVNAAYTNITGISTIQNAGGASTETALTVADAFYIMPAQMGDTEKVWASVYGTFDADGAGTVSTPEQRFWTMAFGGADNIAKELKSGNKYLLTLELAGDGKIDGGTDDPTIETLNQILNITVIPAEWNVSNPHKIFN